MKISQFPSCCGASIITELYPTGTGGFWNTRPNREKTIERILQLICRGIQEQRGIIFAVTNSEQRYVADLLKKFKFKLLKRFYNPRTYSYLRMWQLSIVNKTEEHFDNIAHKLNK